MTLDQLAKQVISFNRARGWDPSSSDTAKSIVIEGAELLELHQWDDDGLTVDKTKASHEVADVFWYLVTYCNKAGLDFAEAVASKLSTTKKNTQKKILKAYITEISTTKRNKVIERVESEISLCYY